MPIASPDSDPPHPCTSLVNIQRLRFGTKKPCNLIDADFKLSILPPFPHSSPMKFRRFLVSCLLFPFLQKKKKRRRNLNRSCFSKDILLYSNEASVKNLVEKFVENFVLFADVHRDRALIVITHTRNKYIDNRKR